MSTYKKEKMNTKEMREGTIVFYVNILILYRFINILIVNFILPKFYKK